MPRATYPIDTDLKTFLRATGLPILQDEAVLDLLDMDGNLAAAISEWERLTRWMPFLASNQTRLFDPPGANRGQGGIGIGGLGGLGGGGLGGSNTLFLDAGLLSVTSVAIGLTDLDSVGTVLTPQSDYWPGPTSAPSAGMPYLSIRFRFPLYGEPESIQIVGIWGRAVMLPDAVWRAILQYAAMLISPQIALLINAGRISRKAGDEEDKFAPFALSAQSDLWKANFDRTVQHYKRMSL